jgi:hypothetical protein
MLAVEAQRRGIPLQAMAQMMGIVQPSAQAFGTTNGTTNQTTTRRSIRCRCCRSRSRR